jgi:hypothetical protein
MANINTAFGSQESPSRGLTSRLNINYVRPDGTQDQGVDQGGVSRDFLTQFFRSLVSSTTIGFSFEQRDGGVLPSTSATNDDGIPQITEEGRRELHTMGRLIGMCYKNRDLLTGPIFDT